MYIVYATICKYECLSQCTRWPQAGKPLLFKARERKKERKRGGSKRKKSCKEG